jgi:hypothetical protein
MSVFRPRVGVNGRGKTGGGSVRVVGMICYDSPFIFFYGGLLHLFGSSHPSSFHRPYMTTFCVSSIYCCVVLSVQLHQKRGKAGVSAYTISKGPQWTMGRYLMLE